jgi:hypothetical protein
MAPHAVFAIRGTLDVQSILPAFLVKTVGMDALVALCAAWHRFAHKGPRVTTRDSLGLSIWHKKQKVLGLSPMNEVKTSIKSNG